MYASARQLVLASLRQFLRLYGHELSERQRERILAHLAREAESPRSSTMA